MSIVNVYIYIYIIQTNNLTFFLSYLSLYVSRYTDMINCLAGLGSDPNQLNEFGQAPLCMASYRLVQSSYCSSCLGCGDEVLCHFEIVIDIETIIIGHVFIQTKFWVCRSITNIQNYYRFYVKIALSK